MNSVWRWITNSLEANSASPGSAITTIVSSSAWFSRAISRRIVIGSLGRSWKGSSAASGRGGSCPRRRLQAGLGQPADEIAQQHAVEMVMADAQRFAGGVDAAGRVEIGREDAHVDVGHELAQQDHAVALLDELGDLLAAQRAFVDADEQRMPLADHALAEHRGRDGDARPFGELRAARLAARSDGSPRRR